MPDKSGERFFAQSREYDMQLKIGGQDFSSDAIKVQIFSSIENPYITVAMEIFVDPNDVLNFLTTDKNIKLTIIPLREIQSQGTTYSLDLLAINISHDFTIKPSLYKDKQPDRVPVKIISVVRKAFTIMSTLVNKVYFEKTVGDIIQDMASGIKDAKVDLDDSNLNTTQIKQVLIPPTTYYKSILYLDSQFGIFKGIPIINCSPDGIVTLINLSKRIDKNYTFTIHQLESRGDNNQVLEQTNDGKNFYTRDNITTGDLTSSKFANIANSIHHIVKPSDKLYSIIDQKLEDVSSNYGVIFKNKNLKLDTQALDRTRYFVDRVGNNDDESYAISRISQEIGNLSSISVILKQNLGNLENLLSSGNTVKFDSKIVEYINLTGKYILESCNMLFRKKLDWNAVASLRLIRTNRQI